MNRVSCQPAELRLLGNIAFLAARMGWANESDAIFNALDRVVETRDTLRYAWISARCYTGRFEGAQELLTQLALQPGVDSQVLLMARCYYLCCTNQNGWQELAQRIIKVGPQAFGYETAQALLDAQATSL